LARHRPCAHPISKPWVTHNDRSRFCFLNHHSHPHLGTSFYKGVIFSWVIFTTFNCSWVKVIGCPINYIFVTYSINAVSSSFCNTLIFPLFYDYVIPYTWLQSDVTSTPYLQIVVWKSSFASMLSIANFREVLSQFPFFFMVFLCYECNCMARSPSPPSSLFVHPSTLGDGLWKTRSIDISCDKVWSGIPQHLLCRILKCNVDWCSTRRWWISRCCITIASNCTL